MIFSSLFLPSWILRLVAPCGKFDQNFPSWQLFVFISGGAPHVPEEFFLRDGQLEAEFPIRNSLQNQRQIYASIHFI